MGRDGGARDPPSSEFLEFNSGARGHAIPSDEGGQATNSLGVASGNKNVEVLDDVPQDPLEVSESAMSLLHAEHVSMEKSLP